MVFVFFLRNKIEHIIKWHFTYPIDKIVNTLIWLFTPKDKVLVLNVWLRHRGNKVRATNLGDDLNYVIVSYLSKKRVVSYMHSYISLFRPQNYMCIGSIVDTLTNSQSIIWGSGAMYGDKERDCVKPKEVLAVRGPLTREYLLSKGIPCPEIYGDPAIILPYLYPPKRKIKYKIGIIPHFADMDIVLSMNIKNVGSNDFVIIDIKHYNHLNSLIDLICNCEFIISSSLHGIILADVYNIPNVWIKVSNNVKGDDFKFYDYFGGCGRLTRAPIKLDRDIDYNKLQLESSKYLRPTNKNTLDLINSCPFIIPQIKQNILNNINWSN